MRISGILAALFLSTACAGSAAAQTTPRDSEIDLVPAWRALRLLCPWRGKPIRPGHGAYRPDRRRGVPLPARRHRSDHRNRHQPRWRWRNPPRHGACSTTSLKRWSPAATPPTASVSRPRPAPIRTCARPWAALRSTSASRAPKPGEASAPAPAEAAAAGHRRYLINPNLTDKSKRPAEAGRSYR